MQESCDKAMYSVALAKAWGTVRGTASQWSYGAWMHGHKGSWLCENADVRKTDGRIISPIANFVARILMRDRF